MTAIAFSDCIRSTPSRTIGALLAAVLSQAGVALVRDRGDDTTSDAEAGMPAQFGLPRGHVQTGAAAAPTTGLPN